LGEFSQEYLDLVDITEDTARNVYENSLYLEARVFTYLYNIEYPDELYEEIMDLYREIYTLIKFEVISTKLEEDGSYSVQVEIAPIDIVQRVEAKLDKVLEPFFKKYPSEVQNAMTTAEYQEFDAEWARLIIDTYRQNIYWAGNLEKQLVTVKLEKNEDGYYSISEEEFKKLDALVIDYSGPQAQPTPTPEPTESAAGAETPDPSATPGAEDPVPPTTASPLPEPEESAPPEESNLPEESPKGTE
ncbi:MAG: hypothetical protein K2F83_07960, partial [Oscillospiraceae bacterium]|nr:hypothetical protein [Oscillospiraceae bacterium]